MGGIGILLPGPAAFDAWRAEARRLLAAEIPPEQVEWHIAGEGRGLFGTEPALAAAAETAVRVPRRFVDLAALVIRNRNGERFALLYRVLWRLTQGEPALLDIPTDPDTRRLEEMAKSVRRDAHKMHAFLRFRAVPTPEGERHLAWFEPEHHILEAEAGGFFARRFAGMRWSILTPAASAHWDGAALRMGPGATRRDAPPEDAGDDLWRTYYAAIFNPARLKPAAMRAEMPVKYWRNMPEAKEIPRLMAEAPRRAAEMVARGATAPAPRRQRAPAQPAPAPCVAAAMDTDPPSGADDRAAALHALRQALSGANDLPPWAAQATQPVFGEGPLDAPLFLIGEQPGDEEDIAGWPFVGPAGRLLDRALAEAGIAREAAYVTNAVKHFKFTPTGRRRLHQSPDAGDITYYRPFLRREIALIGPRLVVTLGATALRAVTGRPLTIGKVRGQPMPLEDGPPLLPTVHPSYLLRLPDPAAKQREYGRFVDDLREAARLAA